MEILIQIILAILQLLLGQGLQALFDALAGGLAA
jgi:hypothetical protein